jgi:hypothetical protein
VRTSSIGDDLQVAGVLKAATQIEEEIIAPQFCLLGFSDNGGSEDPTLRQAIGVYENPSFEEVVGISGSPVFNVTMNALCGMVVRGGLQENKCTIWYMDIFDVIKLLQAIYNGEMKTDYKKTILRKVMIPEPDTFAR